MENGEKWVRIDETILIRFNNVLFDLFIKMLVTQLDFEFRNLCCRVFVWLLEMI